MVAIRTTKHDVIYAMLSVFGVALALSILWYASVNGFVEIESGDMILYGSGALAVIVSDMFGLKLTKNWIILPVFYLGVIGLAIYLKSIYG
ncbi:hypothetical protein A3715_18270 [Oleiphilus sp. HI0009]|nr:hypothetical protein A3715_18270 [Oleiphilus sp. HI0009]